MQDMFDQVCPAPRKAADKWRSQYCIALAAVQNRRVRALLRKAVKA